MPPSPSRVYKEPIVEAPIVCFAVKIKPLCGWVTVAKIPEATEVGATSLNAGVSSILATPPFNIAFCRRVP